MEDEIQTAAQHPNYVGELTQIIKSNISPMALKEKLSDYHDNDIAETLEELTVEDRNKLYRILNAESLANIFEYIENTAPYLDELSVKKKIAVLSSMETDKASEYLKNLPKGERNTLIDFLDDDAKRDLALLASFDDDEIGSKMSTNFIEIKTGITIKEAMKELIDQAAENDNIQTIYVVGANELYYGAIDLKDLIRAREGKTIDDIVSTSYPYVYAHELIDDCVNKLKDYAEDSIPVLDSTNKLIGVITSQDMMELIDDSMRDDYAKFASLGEEEDLEESILSSVKKRLPWLTILLFLGIGVSTVVSFFTQIAAQITILISFQSLILDMAGNSGTQSLAVTIRVLTSDRLSMKEVMKLVWKETRVGFVNGVIMGLVCSLVIGLFIYAFKVQDIRYAFSVSCCTGLALILSMSISTLMGTIIPIVFKKVHIDPAVASGPLITTMNDLAAVIAYYGLAWILLINVAHLGI
jgi:magnesium transporter